MAGIELDDGLDEGGMEHGKWRVEVEGDDGKTVLHSL